MSESAAHLETTRPRLEGLTAVVLAGGQGTRLAPLIGNVPKPLVPVCGLPFLSWVTSWLIGQGVQDVVFSAGHLGEQIEEWVTGLRLPEDIRTSCHREVSPLGTGGALLACLDVCEESVLVVNADTLLLADLPPIVSRFQTDQLDGLIVAVPVADATRFGTLGLGDNGMLRSFHEEATRTRYRQWRCECAFQNGPQAFLASSSDEPRTGAVARSSAQRRPHRGDNARDPVH